MKVTVEEIKSLPPNGILKVKLDTPRLCMSAKNTVQYVKRCYPRPDGQVYKCSIDWQTNTITIKTTAPC